MNYRHLSTILLAAIILFGSPSRASAQLVPEGIHQEARGPAELCGLTAPDALQFMELLRTSPEVQSIPIESDRFELFAADDHMKQWVITRPSEPAHPAVTCRHAFEGPDGSWYQTRSMRCDASREACDRLFIEFQELDERLRQSLEGNR